MAVCLSSAATLLWLGSSSWVRSLCFLPAALNLCLSASSPLTAPDGPPSFICPGRGCQLISLISPWPPVLSTRPSVPVSVTIYSPNVFQPCYVSATVPMRLWRLMTKTRCHPPGAQTPQRVPGALLSEHVGEHSALPAPGAQSCAQRHSTSAGWRPCPGRGMPTGTQGGLRTAHVKYGFTATAKEGRAVPLP